LIVNEIEQLTIRLTGTRSVYADGKRLGSWLKVSQIRKTDRPEEDLFEVKLSTGRILRTPRLVKI
jgi:hypothetical protein